MADRVPGGGGPSDRPRNRLVVGVLVLGLALTACSNAPAPEDASPTGTAAPAVPSASGAPPAAGPLFTSCDGRYECADVRVPLDYANPGGPTIDIAIARQPARDQANKLGILLVNPGGPGGSGIEAVEGGAVPADVAARFDVIGFDPRGVGRSDALACPVGPDTPYDGDPDPGDPAGEAATDAAVNRYVDSCVQRHRDLLPHVGTRDVARDMDRIREALGEQQLNYFGLSYGTSIGQTYGDMFPSRIRAMILDGVVDLALPGLDVSQAESFENSLRQFAANCSANPSCPVRADPIGVVDRVRAKVAAAPIPVPGSRPLTAGRFEMGVVITLYSTQTWPALSRALAAADAGDPRAMSRLAEEYFRGSNSDTYNAVTCIDTPWPATDAEALASVRASAARVPHFVGNVLVSALTCAGWPVPQDPLTPPTGVGLPPVLVVGTTNDPATPYRNSVALAARLPGSALLTYRGDGHTVVGQGVPCVDSAATRYLIDRLLPPPGTTC